MRKVKNSFRILVVLTVVTGMLLMPLAAFAEAPDGGGSGESADVSTGSGSGGDSGGGGGSDAGSSGGDSGSGSGVDSGSGSAGDTGNSDSGASSEPPAGGNDEGQPPANDNGGSDDPEPAAPGDQSDQPDEAAGEEADPDDPEAGDDEVSPDQLDDPADEADPDDPEAGDTEEIGNSYVATVETTTNGLLDKNKEYDFTATFKELNASGQKLGSAQLTIDNNFTDIKDISVQPPTGKSWSFNLVDHVLSLWAENEASYLGQDEFVSILFKATTPDTAGGYTFKTEAWTTANDEFNSVAGSPGSGNNNMADGYYDPTLWVADANDTINLAAGEYGVNRTVEIDKSGVTIQGESANTTIVSGTSENAVPVFEIKEDNVTIRDLGITLTEKAMGLYGQQYDGLLQTTQGLEGINILNNMLWVPEQGSREDMGSWGAFGVKIDRNSEATLTGNIIYNTRQGISGSYGSSLTIEDNDIYNTKGGICIYTNQADIENHTIVNNKWDAPDPAQSHNEWDITWHTGGSYTSSDWFNHYQTFVLALSKTNNDAYVVDRRGEGTTGAPGGNRSHVFVESGSGYDVQNNALGNFNQPLSTISAGIDAAVSGGTVYVAPGTYTEQAVIDKSINLLGQSGAIIKAPDSATRVTQGVTGSTRTFDPIIFINGDENGIEVTIQGFEIDGQNDPGNNTFTGILAYNIINSIISDNILHKLLGDRETMGISVYGNKSDVTVSGNTVTDFSRNAITILDAQTASILNNIITGRGYVGPGWAQNGIQIVGVNTGIISGNKLSEIGWIWPGDGTAWTATGILAYGPALNSVQVSDNELTNVQVAIRLFDIGAEVNNNIINMVDPGSLKSDSLYGILTQGESNYNVFTNNSISNYYIGIYLGLSAADSIERSDRNVLINNNTVVDNYLGLGANCSDVYNLFLRNNLIAGNTFGVWNWTTNVVDALLNFWGHASGPYHEGLNPDGQGDIVSDYVLFDPWYINAAMTLDSNYVAPEPPDTDTGPTGPFVEPVGPFGFDIPFTPFLPGGTGGEEALGLTALTLAPEAPLVNPGDYLVIPPDDPETELIPMVDVPFVEEGTREELDEVIAAYEVLYEYFEEYWEEMTDEEYAKHLLDLSAAWAAIQLREAALAMEAGEEYDLDAVAEAADLAMEHFGTNGEYLNAEQEAAFTTVLDAVAEMLASMSEESAA